MTIYADCTVDSDDIYNEIQLSVTALIDQRITNHTDTWHDDHLDRDTLAAAIRTVLTDIFTNLLNAPFVDPYDRPALHRDDEEETTPTT